MILKKLNPKNPNDTLDLSQIYSRNSKLLNQD